MQETDGTAVGVDHTKLEYRFYRAGVVWRIVFFWVSMLIIAFPCQGLFGIGKMAAHTCSTL